MGILLDGLLAGQLTYVSQQYDGSLALLQNMSHDDEVINFVTLQRLAGLQRKELGEGAPQSPSGLAL